jgi:hypothetical protein
MGIHHDPLGEVSHLPINMRRVGTSYPPEAGDAAVSRLLTFGG